MKAKKSVLTKEEREVLLLAAAHPNGQHLNNTKIGQHLGISVSKVKILIHQACVKLKAHNRNEAILSAIEWGEIGLDEVYTLDELAEFYGSLCPDMLRKIAHRMRQGLEYDHLLRDGEQIVRTDRRQDTILTQSERDVLTLAARGLTNKEIADALYMSISTIRAFLYHAYPKLGVHRRADAVMLALKRGEISVGEIHSPDELLDSLVPLGADTLDKIAQLISQKLEREPVSINS